MVVEAVSSISNKGMTPQITFGKKHKETNQNTVTSPLKAVPVAVLIAMSPLNETTNLFFQFKILSIEKGYCLQ